MSSPTKLFADVQPNQRSQGRGRIQRVPRALEEPHFHVHLDICRRRPGMHTDDHLILYGFMHSEMTLHAPCRAGGLYARLAWDLQGAAAELDRMGCGNCNRSRFPSAGIRHQTHNQVRFTLSLSHAG